MRTLHLSLRFAVLFGIWGCRTNDQAKVTPMASVKAQAISSTAIPACPRYVDISIDIEGGYDVNVNAGNERGTTYPFISWTPTSVSVLEVGQEPRSLGGPTQFPGFGASPRDLCSVEVRGTDIHSACLDDVGQLRSSSTPLQPIAERLKVTPNCVRIDNKVGRRDLTAVQRQWQLTGSACAVKGEPRRRTPVILEVYTPPRASHCWTPGGQVCANLRLKIPAIHFAMELGDLDNWGACGASRPTDSPPGIEYSCSDLGLSSANVYSYGNRVFYRTGYLTDWKSGKLHDVPMRSVELPCGLEPDFRLIAPGSK
jgi:hypothetical protein